MLDQGRLGVIPSESVSGVEVNIHKFEGIDIGMTVLYVFLICREHQRLILVLFLA